MKRIVMVFDKKNSTSLIPPKTQKITAKDDKNK